MTADPQARYRTQARIGGPQSDERDQTALPPDDVARLLQGRGPAAKEFGKLYDAADKRAEMIYQLRIELGVHECRHSCHSGRGVPYPHGALNQRL